MTPIAEGDAKVTVGELRKFLGNFPANAKVRLAYEALVCISDIDPNRIIYSSLNNIVVICADDEEMIEYCINNDDGANLEWASYKIIGEAE